MGQQLPPLTPERRRQRAVYARAKGLHPGSPEALEAERAFKAARLSDHIRQVVETAPSLTPAQRDELARILRPAHKSGDAA